VVEAPDLSVPRRVHVVAAGGAGMSAIATVLAQSGHTVTGSDAVDSASLRCLEAQSVRVQVGHSADAVAGADLVVVSTAVAADNPEVVAARAAGIPVLTRRELLPGLAARQPFLSVAGTHGKTTTSSMLASSSRREWSRGSSSVETSPNWGPMPVGEAVSGSCSRPMRAMARGSLSITRR